ncbi:hypothetical protein [Pelagicoccus sp. SDUM812002]|uniref:hypothetical protein n=1 Tax=Pelagicoccus sp. SDUM812002 TaxID=3041266 RepID=UPI00280DDBDD|nr:hypothetical protein [Pelagicoccus sp. SDUM812002]MDQ8184572.1 hypothetical protein [Pelagicoccus sp. SDUM812002]
MDRVRKLIKERNDMIHTSLKTMDLKSVESCQKEIDFLVLQRNRIQLEINRLKAFSNSLSDLSKDAAEFLKDPELFEQLTKGQQFGLFGFSR